jgi:hypothetical protein
MLAGKQPGRVSVRGYRLTNLDGGSQGDLNRWIPRTLFTLTLIGIELPGSLRFLLT